MSDREASSLEGRSGGNKPFLERVRIRNYRSIKACDVHLGALTFIVGPNGSGKSNFLDALRLVADSLQTSIDHALRDRGGIQEVRRRSTGHPTHFAIRVDFTTSDDHGHFAFEIGAKKPGGFVIESEECRVGPAFYAVRKGTIERTTADVAPPAVDDRLYLVAAAGLPAFRPAFDALSRMGFYSLSPDRMRELQPPDAGRVLRRDGSNLASVLAGLDPEVKRRIEEYLGRVVPGIESVEAIRLGPMETLEFRQLVEGAREPWRFPALNMSDGTLRATGVLTAVFQRAGVPVVGIEEPEIALHPAAAGVLRDCLREGSHQTQIAVTSHSPELLDDSDIPPESILAVSMDHGSTMLAAVDEAARSALVDRLYTAGELLRAGQLVPDPAAAPKGAQLSLFESGK